MSKSTTTWQMARERMVYRYLTALEQGDIDTIQEVLAKAEQDPILEQMLWGLHEENLLTTLNVEQEGLPEVEQHYEELPIGQANLSSSMTERSSDLHHLPTRKLQRLSAFVQAIAAVLVVGALVGSISLLFISHPAGQGARVLQPLDTNGIVVTRAAGGKLTAYSARDGSLLWQRPPMKDMMLMTVEQGVIYVISDLKVYALKISDGSLLWRYTLTTFYEGNLLVDSGKVILSDVYGILSLDARTGRFFRRYPNYLKTDGGAKLLNAYKGVIYATDADGFGKLSLVAFRASDGELLWSYNIPDSASYTVSIDNNVVYVSTFAGPSSLTALHIDTGVPYWQKKPMTGFVGVEHGIIASYTNTNQLCTYRLSDRSLMRCFQLNKQPSGMVDLHGTFYIAFRDEKQSTERLRVEALDARTGKQHWNWYADPIPTSSSENSHLAGMASTDQGVFIANHHTIFALQSSTGKLAWSLQSHDEIEMMFVVAPH